MVTTYMLTGPRHNTAEEFNRFYRWIRKNDVHKWVMGAETGQNGYDHWQIRMQTRYTWDEMCEIWKGFHVEEASDKWEYETKEGIYWTSEDHRENRQMRFGEMRFAQKQALEALRATNDREVMVWYDQTGNVGKSWFTGALWERGLAYVVPPTVDTVKGMMQYVASSYIDHGWRPFVVIDIPRSWKWSEQLYTAIESIKDGLVYDTRYNSRMINIRGVKVLVMCNTLPKLDKLSADRWVIYDTETIADWTYITRREAPST